MEDHLRSFAANLQKYRAAEKALSDLHAEKQKAHDTLQENLAAFAKDIAETMPPDMFKLFVREVVNEAVDRRIPLQQAARRDDGQ
jgi:hypothetical protein